METSCKRLVIGVDQSYTRTGISIGFDGELYKVSSLSYKGLKSKSEKRMELNRVISKILEMNQHKASETMIICERIRTFSGGGKGDDKGFLSTKYIKSTAALIASIVDAAFLRGVKVYSVDTRSWKSKIVGSSKTINNDPKGPTVAFIMNLGFDISSINRDGNIKYDDDAADSGCICLYGFLPEKKQTLMLEE